MCFRKKDKKKEKKKSKEDVGTDVMDKVAGKVPVIGPPYEVIKGTIKGEADAYKGAAGALDEVTSAMTGKKPDMKKIKEGGQVDKKIVGGMKEGAESAGKSIFGGVIDGIKDLWGKIF